MLVMLVDMAELLEVAVRSISCNVREWKYSLHSRRTPPACGVADIVNTCELVDTVPILSEPSRWRPVRLSSKGQT